MAASQPPTDFVAARDAMIDSQLRPLGVNDPTVLAAFAAVPRERFVPEDASAIAYADRSVPLGDGRALPPPGAMGLLLDALLPSAGERALVVGDHSGYTTALLEALGVQVAEASADQSNWRDGEPFDLIVLDGAVELIPDALIANLRDGGRLGGAILDHGVSRLVIGRKAGGSFGLRTISDVAMPPLPGFERPRAFTF